MYWKCLLIWNKNKVCQIYFTCDTCQCFTQMGSGRWDYTRASEYQNYYVKVYGSLSSLTFSIFSSAGEPKKGTLPWCVGITENRCRHYNYQLFCLIPQWGRGCLLVSLVPMLEQKINWKLYFFQLSSAQHCRRLGLEKWYFSGKRVYFHNSDKKHCD